MAETACVHRRNHWRICRRRLSEKSPLEVERPPAPVTVASAVTQDVPIYLDAIGKTVAREVVSIQPQVSGRVTKIHFTDGADVKTGDLLFTIDPLPFEVSLQQARSNLLHTLFLRRGSIALRFCRPVHVDGDRQEERDSDR